MDICPRLRRPISPVNTGDKAPAYASHKLTVPVIICSLSKLRQKQPVSLMTLPTELHIIISKHLAYPDALAFKHTNRHFYSFVDTGIKLKVAWLVHRRQLRSEEHTSELQSQSNLVCRLLLEKKKKKQKTLN